jgi:hypothetical protein
VYTDLQEVDEMVENAYLDDDDAYTDLPSYVPWPLQTPVLLDFVSGWYEGVIVNFKMVNSTFGWYQITWSDGTTGTYTDFSSVDEMVQNAHDYDPWTVGTPVFNENGELDEQVGANLDGTIQTFQGGQYSIQWSDGQVRQYQNFDDVDDLVAAASRKNGQNQDNDDDEPWENGTPVSYQFDDGWWEGTITYYDIEDDTYDITWSDGSVETYLDSDQVDEMVYNAQDDDDDDEIADDTVNSEVITIDTVDDNADDDNPHYEIGTLVYEEFEDGWWVGNIVSYQNGYYVVRWTDNSYDSFRAGSTELAEIVANSQNIPDDIAVQVYPIGTSVYRQFHDGVWYHGVIVAYQESMYTIEWEDGATTQYVQGPEMDSMVGAATTTPNGMSPTGKTILSIVISGVAIGIAACLIKGRVQRTRTVKETNNASVKEVEELEKQLNGYVA